MLIAGGAFAQSSGALEEIVVTAQKREQSIQDVPIAITAFQGSELLDRGIDGVVQLQDITPNLRINQGFGGLPSFAIRGVGELTGGGVVGSDPVAVHINEVAHPYPVTTTSLMFDIERVEVLRGPQGDLFGLNNTGGTINYITARPTKDFSSSVTLEYGEFDRFKVEGFVSGSLSDTVSGRIAVSTNQRNEGWQTNVSTGEKLGEMSRTGVRGSLMIEPSDSFSALLIAHATRDDSDGQGLRLVDTFVNNFGTPVPSFDYFGTQWGTASDYHAPTEKPYKDHEGVGGSAILTWDFENGMSLTSVSGYDKFDRKEWLDWDGSELPDSDQYFESYLDGWSTELRLASDQSESTRWMVGTNVASDELEVLTIFDIPGNPDFPASGGQAPTQDRDIWAVFGHAEIEFNERWELILGLRYTDEERSQVNQGTFLFSDSSPGLGLVDPNLGLLEDLTTAAALTFGSGDIFVGGPTPFQQGTVLTDADFSCFAFVAGCFEGNGGVPWSDSFSEGMWSGKVGVNFRPTEDVLLYASYSRGQKSGTFLDTAASVSSQMRPTRPETLNAYEVGIKSTLADNSVRLNAAVFYYDYKDQQVGDSIVDPLFGALGALVNAPKSENIGAELEIDWRPVEGLTIQQGIGYTRAEYVEFQSIDGDAVQNQSADPNWDGIFRPVFQDLSGQRLNFPDLQLNGLVSYQFELAGGYSMLLAADYYHESEGGTDNRHTLIGSEGIPADVPVTTDGNGVMTTPARLDARTIVNARVSLISQNNWELTAFGHNILDEKYLEAFNRWNRGLSMVPGMPSTWGIRFRMDFD